MESCCAQRSVSVPAGSDKILIVGNPNVGKSALFNRLTGSYATVSNYPGTTVEILQGKMSLGERHYQVMDTPGIYTFIPLSEEERTTRQILLSEAQALVIHVVEARNLERMLPFTLQLIEAGFHVILVLNMMDEAERSGVSFNLPLLEKELGIPVVGTVSITGRGVDKLKERIKKIG